MRYRNLSLRQIKKLAERLARQIADKPVVIGLAGNLGSGKTTFAKSFAYKLGLRSLKSPSFIVSQRYPLKGKWLYHIDLYRLDSQKQLQPLGLDEILSGKNIVLIEWVDKFPKLKKKCDILINLYVKLQNLRDVTIEQKK